MQSGILHADSTTSLYNLHVEDIFPIRCDPKKPERFYCAEAVSSLNELRWITWIMIGLGIAVSATFAAIQR